MFYRYQWITWLPNTSAAAPYTAGGQLHAQDEFDNLVAACVTEEAKTLATPPDMDEEVPTAGVLTDHEAELSKILNNIDTWGLNVLTANEIIKTMDTQNEDDKDVLKTTWHSTTPLANHSLMTGCTTSSHAMLHAQHWAVHDRQDQTGQGEADPVPGRDGSCRVPG